MVPQRPATAVDRMQRIRGHLQTGLKQELTVRVFAPGPNAPRGSASVEIDGVSYSFSTREEALRQLDEYLRRAFDRASEANGTR